MNRSILVEYEKIDKVIDDRPFINIGNRTEYTHGNMLCKYYKTNTPFDTLFGDVIRIKNVMDFLTIPNYPITYLVNPNITKKDYKKLSTVRVSIPNYWSIITHVVWERIVSDKELLDSLLRTSDDTVITSFKETRKSYKGNDIVVKSYEAKMARYTAVVKYVIKSLKTYKENGHSFGDSKELTKAMFKAMVETKDKPDKKVFADLPFELCLPSEYNI